MAGFSNRWWISWCLISYSIKKFLVIFTNSFPYSFVYFATHGNQNGAYQLLCCYIYVLLMDRCVECYFLPCRLPDCVNISSKHESPVEQNATIRHSKPCSADGRTCSWSRSTSNSGLQSLLTGHAVKIVVLVLFSLLVCRIFVTFAGHLFLFLGENL